jgi:hypothetical protein
LRYGRVEQIEVKFNGGPQIQGYDIKALVFLGMLSSQACAESWAPCPIFNRFPIEWEDVEV